MSEIETLELAARADELARSEREDEPRGGFLFSPWHLVLIPIAFVMVIPQIGRASCRERV